MSNDPYDFANPSWKASRPTAGLAVDRSRNRLRIGRPLSLDRQTEQLCQVKVKFLGEEGSQSQILADLDMRIKYVSGGKRIHSKGDVNTIQDQSSYVWHDNGISRVVEYVLPNEHRHCVGGSKRPAYDADATFGAFRARLTNGCVLDEIIHKSYQCLSDILKEHMWIFEESDNFCICIFRGSCIVFSLKKDKAKVVLVCKREEVLKPI